MNINDAILAATGGPTINDGLLAFYQANGATSNSLNDAEYEYLIANGATAGQVNDMWFDLLTQAGFTGALNDMKLQFWLGGGVSPSPDYSNIVPNSSLAGMSGSVSGADWIPPTGWGQGFWPPTDATALTDSIEFVAVDARGFITAEGFLSEGIYNASCYVDEVMVGSAQKPIVMQAATGVSEIDGSNNNTLSVGRKWATYNVTVPGTVTFRFGCGTTATTNQHMILSRPQVTEGADLRPYLAT